MATAPEFFHHAVRLEIESTPLAADEIRDGRRSLTAAILRRGAAGAALVVAALMVFAVAEARLADQAFLRVFGWF